MPRQAINWKKYNLHHANGGTDAAFAKSLRMDANNFAQHKKRWLRDLPTIAPTVSPEPVAVAPVAIQKLALASLCLDAGTQMRADDELPFVVGDYAEAMKDGAKFPPVTVFSDGTTSWLADGFQRVKAAQQIRYTEIHADIRPGSLRDAILFSCGANAQHGLRRTPDDKRKSALTLLQDPEWSTWSDNKIAGVCGLSQTFVSEVRRSLSTKLSEDSSTRQYVNKHGTTTTMRTRNIGKKASGEGTSFVSVTVTTAIHQDEPTTPPEEAPAQNDAPEPPSLALPFPEEHGQPTTVPPLLPEPTANLRHLAAVTDEALVQLAMLGEAARVEGYPEYRDLEATLRVLQQGIGWEVASREVPDA